MRTTAAIGMGSNLGDRQAILQHAVVTLGSTAEITLLDVSRNFETAPVGGPPGQGPFLNAAVTLETELTPIALHTVLKEIERQAGRRRVVRWGERTLDLDLLLFGDHEIDSEGLIVPHPRMAFRRFVLEPLASIAAEMIHPMTGRTVANLLANLDVRPLAIGLFGWDAEAADALAGVTPEFVVAKRLEVLNPDAVGSLQFLVAARDSRDAVSQCRACRPIPTLYLDPEGAEADLAAACLSVL